MGSIEAITLFVLGLSFTLIIKGKEMG